LDALYSCRLNDIYRTVWSL